MQSTNLILLKAKTCYKNKEKAKYGKTWSTSHLPQLVSPLTSLKCSTNSSSPFGPPSWPSSFWCCLYNISEDGFTEYLHYGDIHSQGWSQHWLPSLSRSQDLTSSLLRTLPWVPLEKCLPCSQYASTPQARSFKLDCYSLSCTTILQLKHRIEIEILLFYLTWCL